MCLGTIHISTVASPYSEEYLDAALAALLSALTTDQEQPEALYQLRYEQRGGLGSFTVDNMVGSFAPPPPGLTFDDDPILASVRQAWDMVMRHDARHDEYMKFTDREGALDDYVDA